MADDGENSVTTEEVLATIHDRDVKFVRLWFTDILGQLKSVATTSENVASALERGMRFDGSSVTGFNAIEESDMIAMPDPSTFTVLPYRPQEQAVARMFCDIRLPGGEAYEGDSRHVLRRALARADRMGFDLFAVSPDLEYYYVSAPDDPRPVDQGGYFDLTTLDAATDVRRDTVLALQAMGIRTQYSHHEVGPSQHEIDMRYDNALSMADNVMTYRTVVKEIAHKHGYYATFMPKPISNANGSGMHTHQSLFRDDENAFHDASDDLLLSQTAKQFVAGQLRHAREMSVVFAQWVNSYKRLVPGYEAPVHVAWSRRNRSALMRVPMLRRDRPESARVEIRCPDPACNPYLTFAALLHAGLDGIEHGYELPEAMDTNLYDLTHEERERAGIEALPESLGEAVEIGAESEFLLRAFGEHVHERLIDLKRREWSEYRGQVTPWEIDRYLDIL